MNLNAWAFRIGATLALLVCAAATSETTTGELWMAPMRDGALLATEVFLPEGEGPFPTVLTRSVYGRGAGATLAPAYNERGLAFVIQDTRGRGGSQGKDMVFTDDGWGRHQDGHDTVYWIKMQPWSDGQVATWGGSALGITQLLAAASGADIAAQSVLVAASNFYGQLSYQGGVWRKSLCEGWTESQGNEYIVDIWKNHPTYGEYWEQFNTEQRAEYITAPGLHVGGWFDIFAQGTINSFVTRQYEGGEGARGNQFLVMGPWPHGVTRETGDLRFPENYDFDIADFERRLFQHWLFGEDAGIDEEPAVHYYTMGDVDDPDAPGNEWRTADTWPPFETEETPLYLAGDGLLSMEPMDDGSAAYAFDPANPVPTRGGQNLLIPSGPTNQAELGERNDVLTFATEPLDKPIEITGPVSVRVFVSSDAVDTDFTAKLVDIYPDGREILMLDSIQRVKFRNGFAEPDLLPPGEVGELTIDLWSISLVFNKGHRIGLHVSSSNYPRFDVNPNTGEDFPGENGREVANNTVHWGEEYPSALLLPVRPRDNVKE